MKIAALVSGGKDSLYASYLASKEHELVCLVSLKSKNTASYMFHVPNIELTKLQAGAIGLPIIFKETKGEKEKELKDLKKAIEFAVDKYAAEGLVSGALYSEYQKKRIDNICKELGIKSLAPLWHRDAEEYLKELVKAGFEVIITAIAAEGLDKSYLGAKIDKNMIEKLKTKNINIAFEGREAETFVLKCPLFNKKIEIKRAKIKMEKEYIGQYIIEDAVLA